MLKTNACVRLLSFALLAGTVFAQDGPVRKYYRLDFALKEVEGGKVLNARTYSTTVMVDPSTPTSIRTGGKVSYPSLPGSSQFQFLEVGVNIDCRDAREVQNELYLQVSADVTTAIPASEMPSGGIPVLRTNRWSANVIVAPRKPTMLFSSDDLGTKRQMQLELTATPITPAK